MKAWHFQVSSNPKEISEKLESALGPVNGFVFNMKNDKHDTWSFKVRKRVQYVWYMIFLNYVIVNGKLLKTAAMNVTDVEITFTQHFLMKTIIFAHVVGGFGFLIIILSGISSGVSMYITGGVLLAIGIVLLIDLQKRFDKKAQEYKTLISEILALQ